MTWLHLDVVLVIDGEGSPQAAAILTDLADRKMLNLPLKDLVRRELAGQVEDVRIVRCETTAQAGEVEP